MADVWVFVFSMVDGISLLFLSVYFIVTLSDLECDYINARSCCTKLNRLVLPEIIGQTAQSVLLFISWHWMLCLLGLPLTAWQIYRFARKPSGNIGVYDPTEIHNRSLLKYYMKESMIKLGCHLVFFFLFLYNLIISLLS